MKKIKSARPTEQSRNRERQRDREKGDGKWEMGDKRHRDKRQKTGDVVR